MSTVQILGIVLLAWVFSGWVMYAFIRGATHKPWPAPTDEQGSNDDELLRPGN